MRQRGWRERGVRAPVAGAGGIGAGEAAEAPVKRESVAEDRLVRTEIGLAIREALATAGRIS
jgi:hypothetical protein